MAEDPSRSGVGEATAEDRESSSTQRIAVPHRERRHSELGDAVSWAPWHGQRMLEFVGPPSVPTRRADDCGAIEALGNLASSQEPAIGIILAAS
jgi:hypothetical protein